QGRHLSLTQHSPNTALSVVLVSLPFSSLTLVTFLASVCFQEYCENIITVLQRLDENKILVCGTNAQIPKCWHLVSRRSTNMTCDLVSSCLEPIFTNFVQSDDLIFMFFREKRVGTKNWEVDPWISRIARVCKADKGGSESDLFNKWTTFLKARLVCSLPSQNLHFNRVEDVSIDKSNMSSETRVYGIFSNRWNSTAVCVYSMGDILNVFKNSNFKGFTGKIPDHRPGTCVADSQRVPRDTLIFISRHPEMEQPINPIGGKPIIISKQHYFKKIVVDRIVGKAGLISHVLYLATENGKIQKVVEINESTFVISEIKVLSKPGPILSMFLDSQTKHLYINSAEELERFPMPQCFRHTNTCENCVMARDPDCGWNSIRKQCETFDPKGKMTMFSSRPAQ
uniref:Sema domain-containing protein n=1 Tax=Callorhinchus milii TaxID=7868 RepID=A0A4W3GY37_CALMI